MANEDKYINKSVINDNYKKYMFSTRDSNLQFASFFGRYAPIYWTKYDINACITSQFVNALFNTIPTELETVKNYTFLYMLDQLNGEMNQQEDEVVYRPETESFVERFCFFIQRSKILENHHMISQLITAETPNALSAIRNTITNSINYFIGQEKTTLYELVILISDINQFAQYSKLMYVNTSNNRILEIFGNNDGQKLFVISFLIKILEIIFENTLTNVYSQKYLQKNDVSFHTSFSDAEKQVFKDNILKPFPLIYNPNKSDNQFLKNVSNLQGSIPAGSVHYILIFAYLSAFQIIEVLISNYSENDTHSNIHSSVNSARFQYLMNIYRLLRLLPVLNEFDYFLSSFPTAFRSFINICWFLRVLQVNSANVPFLDEIIIKTFANELVHLDKDESAKPEEKSNLTKQLFDCFSLTFSQKNKAGIDKMKATYTLYSLKYN